MLALADGTVFRGASFGAQAVGVGEVCFNTSLTGYQEILTDPSYAGQIVTMTATQIGNVGVNSDDEESVRPFLAGFVVKEYFEVPSSWRSESPLGVYLERYGVPALSDIDTRALVRRIRDGGFQMGVLSTDPARQDADALVAEAASAPDLDGRDLASEVSCEASYRWSAGRWSGVQGQCPRAARPTPVFRLVAYDFGIKRNILRRLVDEGFEVTVVPARTPAVDVAALEPDAVFLSNGPGDPAGVHPGIFDAVRTLSESLPMFGICLGHQILGLALGGRTRKLKFGHHGGNQPGQDRSTGKVAICAENHGYAVDAESLEAAGEPVDVTHVNLNDGTVEGLAHRSRPLFSVQYHPEASPGPHDAAYLFRRFRAMVARHRAGEAVTGADVAAQGV
ncbi:MAG: glutamine-hydrolyzing carbamoyl-phosphate synthase small subunit [bacterium]|jgi:carbamoyl-phosphate synthase small subunit|nr:carbamoyl phosphate synthase small subunit [Deltaproteobacteria bacterium]MCP4239252.1 glutamine-hydrolyzing carbamoyl-phosphate synthase small subunit [bacterium]